MKVTFLLCDHAVVADGKLFINGGGWTVTGPNPVPSALALLIDVPWDQANRRLPLVVQLFSEDGQPVTQDGPMGPQPLRVQAEFEVGRPPGIPPGAPLTVPIAVNLAPIPLSPGGYYWDVEVDGEREADWRARFVFRPAQATPTADYGPAGIPPIR